MNLQQLRYLHGIAEQGFNISRAATALHTSQPGISKQIRLLEQEIGIAILARKGNRIVGVTEPGRAILDVARGSHAPRWPQATTVTPGQPR